jgi:ATP-dependent helicase/nuclease subunit B
MEGCVLYGTSFTELRTHAFAWLDKRAGDTPESALLLEENSPQRDALAAEWRANYNALRLISSGLASIGQTAHERLFGPYPDIGTQERRRILEQALETAETPAQIKNPRHHVDAISELFRDLEAAGIQDVEALRAQLSDAGCSDLQSDLLTEVYKQYQTLVEAVAHPDAIPRSAKLAAVADADDIQTAFPHVDAVVVSGLYDPNEIEIKLLERLAETFPTLVIVPTATPTNPTTALDAGIEGIVDAVRRLDFDVRQLPSDESETQPLAATVQRLYQPVESPESPPENLSWHEAPTPDREINHLARRLRDRLAAGADPNDMLVLAPGLLSYRDGITDTFDAYGIGHTYQATILLERTYAGRAVLDVLSLCEQPNSGHLSELATNPLVSLPEVNAAEVADLHRRLYTTAIEPFIEELEDSTAGIKTLLERAEAVRDADPEHIQPTIEALLKYIQLDAMIESLDSSVNFDAEYETSAFRQVQRSLDSVDRICKELDLDDPLAEAIGSLEGVRVNPKRQNSDGRIEVIGLQDTPMADFEELYILGATAQHLSGGTSRPRFFQSIGEALDLFEPNERRNNTRYRFGILLANASRVHITTPETTLNDESVLASPLIDELSRVTGLEPSTGVGGERRGNREDLQRAMAGATPAQLEPAMATAHESGYISESFVTAATRGAACAHDRADDKLTAHDGQLTAEAMGNLDDTLDARPFSHSRMTGYAKCGFKHMLRKGWGFEGDDDIEPGASPLTIGSVIHEAVEAFYRSIETRFKDGGSIDLTILDREVLERELLAAGRKAVENAEENFDDTFGNAKLIQLFAGLSTPEENEYYDRNGTVESSFDGTLALFLRTELERAEEGHHPTAFEKEFGAESGVSLSDDTQLPVHGFIDRIDAGDNGVTIFDYKSSSVNRTRNRENNARDGVDFQLPIYTLGTPSLFPDRPELSPTDIDARYYILNDDPQVTLRDPLSDQFDFDYGTFLIETIPRRISDLIDSISAGAFHPTLAGAQTAECEYCAFSDVCDVRHHRRYDVIDAIDDNETKAYVPDGARPTDIGGYLPGGGE